MAVASRARGARGGGRRALRHPALISPVAAGSRVLITAHLGSEEAGVRWGVGRF